MWRRVAALMFPLALCSCATSFTGSAYFPGGAAGCQAKCQSDGLDMGAFVYAGEFSTACVCKPRNHSAQADTDIGVSASVGVMTNMRAAQEQAQRQGMFSTAVR